MCDPDLAAAPQPYGVDLVLLRGDGRGAVFRFTFAEVG